MWSWVQLTSFGLDNKCEHPQAAWHPVAESWEAQGKADSRMAFATHGYKQYLPPTLQRVTTTAAFPT